MAIYHSEFGKREAWTDWKLIRETLNGVIDACEKVEQLHPNISDGEYTAESGKAEDLSVGDLLERFWRYPEGAQRDIIRLRNQMKNDMKYKDQLARAIINTACACAEIIGVSKDDIEKEFKDFDSHCGSGGYSLKSLLQAIPKIQNGWMYNGIKGALEKFRKQRESTKGL